MVLSTRVVCLAFFSWAGVALSAGYPALESSGAGGTQEGDYEYVIRSSVKEVAPPEGFEELVEKFYEQQGESAQAVLGNNYPVYQYDVLVENRSRTHLVLHPDLLDEEGYIEAFYEAVGGFALEVKPLEQMAIRFVSVKHPKQVLTSLKVGTRGKAFRVVASGGASLYLPATLAPVPTLVSPLK